jgi:uncharacterized lipoprotein YddW (UPF0748 family)
MIKHKPIIDHQSNISNQKTTSVDIKVLKDVLLNCVNHKHSDFECITSWMKDNDINPLENEVRGMWHRPFEESLEDVIETLDELKTMGINHLFVETFFNGKLIFKSQNSLTLPHDFVKSYGPYQDHLLKAFIEEGKQRGIKIHAWVENFFIGVFSDAHQSKLVNLRPSWAMYNHDGSMLQKNEKNYLFLDPANQEVRSYLLDIYEEILALDGLESLHLDYIRYPVVNGGFTDLSDDTGYSSTALQQFLGHNDQQKFIQNLKADHQLYQSWVQFKTNIITQFVKATYERSSKYHVGLSTAVFGDPKHALNIKCQDWFTWVKNGWIDMICPMAYYKDYERVYHEIKALIDLTSPYAKACGGIAPAYMGLNSIDNIKQMLATKMAGADGFIMFATQNYLTKSFMGQKMDAKAHREILQSLKEEENHEKHSHR